MRYSKGKMALQAEGASKFTASCAQREFPTMTNWQTTFPLPRILRTRFFMAAPVFFLMVLGGASRAQEPKHSLELSRTVRPWEFLPVTGMRAGLLGDESGRMEAWVYPPGFIAQQSRADRKSTRLNSSHSQISYAVFCLKKKKRKDKI